MDEGNTIALALNIFVSIVLFYFVNAKNPMVRYYTWDSLQQITSIIVAMMIVGLAKAMLAALVGQRLMTNSDNKAMISDHSVDLLVALFFVAVLQGIHLYVSNLFYPF